MQHASIMHHSHSITYIPWNNIYNFFTQKCNNLVPLYFETKQQIWSTLSLFLKWLNKCSWAFISLSSNTACFTAKAILLEDNFSIMFLYPSIRTDAHSHFVCPGSLSLLLHHNLRLIKSHHSYFPYDVAICHWSFSWMLCKCPKPTFCLVRYYDTTSLQE